MDNKAQSKLGELYVELGIGGLGKTLKGLNNVSAQFLLTKNAAIQLTKPLLSMTKSFGQSAVGLEKMKLTFGTTIQQAQRMQAVFKKLGIEEIGGDIQKISDMLAAKNYKGLGSDFLQAINYLNIPIQKYSGSLEDTLKLLDRIGEGLDEITKREGAASGRMWSSMLYSDYTNLMYARERGIKFSDLPKQANELSQQQVNDLIRSDEQLKQLQMDVFKAFQSIFANNSQKIIGAFNKLDDIVTSKDFSTKIQDIINFTSKNWDWIKTAFIGYLFGGRAGAIAALGLKGAGEAVKSGNIPLSVSPYGTSAQGQIDLSPEVLKNTFSNNNLPSKAQVVNIEVTQNINSTDPYLAGSEAARKFEDTAREARAFGLIGSI